MGSDSLNLNPAVCVNIHIPTIQINWCLYFGLMRREGGREGGRRSCCCKLPRPSQAGQSLVHVCALATESPCIGGLGRPCLHPSTTQPWTSLSMVAVWRSVSKGRTPEGHVGRVTPDLGRVTPDLGETAPPWPTPCPLSLTFTIKTFPNSSSITCRCPPARPSGGCVVRRLLFYV